MEKPIGGPEQIGKSTLDIFRNYIQLKVLASIQDGRRH